MINRNKKADRSELGVYIFGRHEVLIDGGAVIREYSGESVTLSLGKTSVKINGSSLTVRAAGEGACEIRGRIDGLTYGTGGADGKTD